MYFKLTHIAVLAFAASVAVEAGSDVSKSSSAVLQLRADSSQTHGSPSAALTWMINGQGDDVSRIGPVVVTCDPNYKTLAKENPCAGVDFFVRMTPGLEEHIKVIIVRDDVSGRYVSSTASTSLSDADSGHTSQKLCGEWTLDECFVNRQFTYTSSWKDLNNAYTAVTALAADGNQTTSNAGSIISHEARGVQYSSRIAGSMYNVHLNSRHIYIQLDGWTPEISKMMSLHSFIQVEVRFNGSNSLRTGLYGFGLSALLILLLGVGLFNIRKVGLRRYGLIDQLRPIQIWSFGVNGQSVVPVPVLQLPEIVGQPVTPARLLRQKKERVNAAGTEATAVTPTAEDEPTWRDRLFSLMGGVKRPKFERAPVEETADIDAAPSGKVSTVVDIEERQADTQPLRERREDDDDEMTHRDAVSGKAEPPAIASDDDPDELICRICQDGSPRNDLFAPCKCSGTSKYVHKQCLDHWRHSTANPLHRTTCAECKTLYVEKPPEAPSPGACLTPIARQLKLATGFAALLLFGGYAVKWLAFLMTRDAGINWWPNEYHVFLGSMFVISELMTVSCCAHFFTGFPIHFTRSVLWIAGWMLPAAFGYVAQFFIWVTEVVVWRPEISYGAGVAALFVTSQYFLPTLNEYVQRAEMTYLLERESATRQQHAETLAAMAAAAAAARAQRAANAQGDEEPHNADTDEETTDEEVEMAPQPADDAAAVPSPVAQPPPAPTTTQDDSLSPSREA